MNDLYTPRESFEVTDEDGDVFELEHLADEPGWIASSCSACVLGAADMLRLRDWIDNELLRPKESPCPTPEPTTSHDSPA